MKTIGIIAEFNPFHYGHKYLIEEAKKNAQADFCVVVMSGNFVQRGAPALMDKYSRTRMALLGGADLVLELPVCYATASAEYFARGAVRLLDKLGVIDTLCFGSECGDINILENALNLLDNESSFGNDIKKNIKKGMSYPRARAQAIESNINSNININIEATQILNQPNNILGIEYIKALNYFQSAINKITIKRKGAGYHDKKATAQEFSSATAIRKLLSENKQNISSDYLTQFVPQNTTSLYQNQFLKEDDFSALLNYKLLLESETGYTRFFDVSNDLSDKIKKNLNNYNGYTRFIDTLKSKDLTYMRISRCLCHILLDIRDDDINFFKEHDYIFYARMLGFNENAAELLNKIKKNSDIPLLSKLADARKLLNDVHIAMLKKDIQAADIYNVIYKQKNNISLNEYTAPIEKYRPHN